MFSCGLSASTEHMLVYVYDEAGSPIRGDYKTWAELACIAYYGALGGIYP